MPHRSPSPPGGRPHLKRLKRPAEEVSAPKPSRERVSHPSPTAGGGSGRAHPSNALAGPSRLAPQAPRSVASSSATVSEDEGEVDDILCEPKPTERRRQETTGKERMADTLGRAHHRPPPPPPLTSSTLGTGRRDAREPTIVHAQPTAPAQSAEAVSKPPAGADPDERARAQPPSHPQPPSFVSGPSNHPLSQPRPKKRSISPNKDKDIIAVRPSKAISSSARPDAAGPPATPSFMSGPSNHPLRPSAPKKRSRSSSRDDDIIALSPPKKIAPTPAILRVAPLPPPPPPPPSTNARSSGSRGPSRPAEDDPLGPSDTWDVRILCWNVNGLERLMVGERDQKKTWDMIDSHEPDILVLTNHKVPPALPDADLNDSKDGIDPFKERGYRSIWWSNALKEEEGVHGVVVMSRCRDLALSGGCPRAILSGDGLAGQGRFMLVEFDSFMLLATLFHASVPKPSPRDSHDVIERHKQEVLAKALLHRRVGEILPAVEGIKPVILVGSFATHLDLVQEWSDRIANDGFYASHKLAQLYKKTHEGNEPLVDVATCFRGEIKLPDRHQNTQPKTEENGSGVSVPQWAKKKPDWTFQKVDANTKLVSPLRVDGFIVSPRLLPRIKSYRVLDIGGGGAEAWSPYRPILLEMKGLDELGKEEMEGYAARGRV